MDRPRLCFDRALPAHLLVPAAHHAAALNPRNIPVDHPWLDGLYPGDPALYRPAIALQVGKLWPPGTTIKVGFYSDVSPALQARLMGVWQEWTQYANIAFGVAALGNADIRVTTRADRGSWSVLGTDCHLVPHDQPTMNYGWLDDSTDDTEVKRVGLHEMGHGLAAVHEHQNPDGGLVWNVAQVMQDYEGAPNYWSPDEIQQQVIQKYSQTQLFSAAFDRTSIMEYPIAPGEATDQSGRPVVAGWNTDLSAEDRSFIAQMYPRSGPPPTTIPGGGGGGGTGNPPPPPSGGLTKIVPGAGPSYDNLAGGQVGRYDLAVGDGFVIVRAKPMAAHQRPLNLTIAGVAAGAPVYAHGSDTVVARLQAGEYLLTVASPDPAFAGLVGIAARPLMNLETM